VRPRRVDPLQAAYAAGAGALWHGNKTGRALIWKPYAIAADVLARRAARAARYEKAHTMSATLHFLQGMLTRSRGRVTRNFASRISALPAEPSPQANIAIRIDALLQVRAALDAALALLAYDLPDWSVRSLVREVDGWHCGLSANPGVPAGLDDIATGDGPTPARAILAAMTAARCQNEAAGTRRYCDVAGADGGELSNSGVSCDDYA